MVFDKLLIEYMTERYDLDVAYVVRSVPTLNDATLHEARVVGLHNVATVIENGIDGPCPGTILRRCSPDVKERLSNADMIISKGGGNFDALEEERGDVRRKITFMLLSKCYPYCQYFDVQMHQPILAHLAL